MTTSTTAAAPLAALAFLLASATLRAQLTPAPAKATRAGGQPGKLVFALSAATSADVTMSYQVSGSAVAGTDYKPLPGRVSFAAGQTSTTVKVKPRAATDAGSADPTAAVKVKLRAGEGYTVGSDAAAKVKIVDGD